MCRAMFDRLALAEFHYNYVIENLPQIIIDRQMLITLMERVLAWGKNIEGDRTAVAKAGQEVDALIKIYKKRMKKAKKQ